MLTTLKLSGGDLGAEVIIVRCDLTRAEAPVEIDYCADDRAGFEATPYQCSNCSHSLSGLILVAARLASRAVEIPESRFSCNFERS